MSSAALAKKRRANAPPPPIEPRSQSSPIPAPTTQPVGLTLPQVIALVDTRLTTLETFMKSSDSNQSSQEINPEIFDDYESRFQMLATEITEMKDIVLKLQTFTMEVNKRLLEKNTLV
jgi:hypothetical protein